MLTNVKRTETILGSHLLGTRQSSYNLPNDHNIDVKLTLTDFSQQITGLWKLVVANLGN